MRTFYCFRSCRQDFGPTSRSLLRKSKITSKTRKTRPPICPNIPSSIPILPPNFQVILLAITPHLASKRNYAKATSPIMEQKAGKTGTTHQSSPSKVEAKVEKQSEEQHAASFQGDEDLLHESMHKLVKDDKPMQEEEKHHVKAHEKHEEKPEVFSGYI